MLKNKLHHTMSKLRPGAIMTLGMFALATCSGCITAAKRAFKEAKGEESEVTLIPETLQSDFQAYQSVALADPRTDLGALVSEKFIDSLPAMLQIHLIQNEGAPFPGGPGTLQIEPVVMWYHKRSGAGGLMGSDSFAITLFYLRDNGHEIGRVQVVTKSGASRTEPPDMADSAAKQLAEWFNDRKAGKPLEKPKLPDDDEDDDDDDERKKKRRNRDSKGDRPARR